jgi:pantoate--beta-alanine ligase
VSIKSSKPASATAAIPARGTDRSAEPRIVREGHALRQQIVAARQAGQSVGLVPTMGALHEGHLSLVDAARAECDLVVTTIFVNPTQFAPGEDLRRYPRDMDRDLAMLKSHRCDLVFAPSEADMYPPGHVTFVDVGVLGQVLEGKFRPTHFRGVATVVMKLFQLAPATRVYFGRKDYQQTLVVRQMVADLNVPIDVRVCPTVREPDGLAMSSRNAYLSTEEREQALALSKSLRLAERLVQQGEREVTVIDRAMRQEIGTTKGVDVHYIAFVADGTVTPVTKIDGPTTIAIAATVGGTRLIDNMLVNAGVRCQVSVVSALSRDI